MTYLPLSETTIPQTPYLVAVFQAFQPSPPPFLPLSPLLTLHNLPRCSVTHLFGSVERRIGDAIPSNDVIAHLGLWLLFHHGIVHVSRISSPSFPSFRRKERIRYAYISESLLDSSLRILWSVIHRCEYSEIERKVDGLADQSVDDQRSV